MNICTAENMNICNWNISEIENESRALSRDNVRGKCWDNTREACKTCFSNSNASQVHFHSINEQGDFFYF